MGLRSALDVQPHLYMGDVTGRPLDYGMVFFGQSNKDPEFYPINIYYDENLTIPAAQPVRTKGGFLNANGDMCEIFAKELTYSVKVLDQYGRKVFYKGDMTRTNTSTNVSTQLDELNTVVRTQAEKNNDFVSIKDFGAIGDGIADDTQAFNGAVASGRAIFIPSGEYSLNNTILLQKNRNAYVYGEGKGKTVLAFNTGGLEKEFGNLNGEIFNIKDLSIQTKSVNPNAAIRCFRSDSNAAYESGITIDNIEVSCFGGVHASSNTFKYGVRLEYVRFVKVTNCQIWGQEGYIPTAENPNAVAGISILCSDTVGQFGFLLTNNFVSGFTNAVKAEGWYEGLYVTGGEYWVAYYGFFLNHPAVSANSPMTGTVKITNLHANGAKYPIFAQNVSNIGINNCDLQNGIGGGNSNNPALILLNNCPRSTINATSMGNFYNKPCNGIYLQSCNGIVVSNCVVSDVTDNVFLIANSTNVSIVSNAVLAPNFKANSDVYATSDSTGFLSKNQLAGQPVNKGGLTYDPPRMQYTGVATLKAGANDVTITPPRTLSVKPDSVIVTTEYSSAGTVNAYYNYSASSTTAIVITLNAAAAGTYRYSVEYPLN